MTGGVPVFGRGRLGIAILAVFVLVGMLALVSACGDDDDGGDGGTSQEESSDGADTVDVAIVDFAFEPAEVTVSAGSRVRWENRGETAHTTRDVNEEMWASPALAPGRGMTVEFLFPGRWEYHCTIHPEMTGTVIVE